MKNKIVVILSLVSIIVCSTLILKYNFSLKNTDNIYMNLQSNVDDLDVSFSKEMNKKYSVIYNQNNDLVGWINDGNKINYPIVSCKDEYYLRHDFYGNSSVQGCLYTQNDSLNDKVSIVHGHNMRNGSMFGTLDNYKSVDSYKDFKISDLYSTFRLKPLASVICGVSEDDFDYYNYYGNLSDTDFSKLIKELSKNLICGSLDSVKSEDKLVLLSTCDYSKKDSRFILVLKYDIQ